MKVELTNGQIKLINNMINCELHEINKTVYDGKELRDLKQALNLGDVSQQSELLFAFFMWFRENGEKYMNESIEKMIQIYLKANYSG